MGKRSKAVRQIRNHAKIKIDEKEFERLCFIQCTQQEIADWFRVSPDTIDRWCKLHYRANFAEIFAQKRGNGKISLRRQMFQNATANNNTVMQIWLSKQYLGMADKQEVKQETTSNVNIDMTKFKFVEPKED